MKDSEYDHLSGKMNIRIQLALEMAEKIGTATVQKRTVFIVIPFGPTGSIHFCGPGPRTRRISLKEGMADYHG